MRIVKVEAEVIIMSFENIASGVASVHVPEYITVSTGKYSDEADKVKVDVKQGNKDLEPVYADWVKMHGVRAVYRKHGSIKRTTIHDNAQVTFMSTGDWRVQVEKPV